MKSVRALALVTLSIISSLSWALDGLSLEKYWLSFWSSFGGETTQNSEQEELEAGLSFLLLGTFMVFGSDIVSDD